MSRIKCIDYNLMFGYAMQALEQIHRKKERYSWNIMHWIEFIQWNKLNDMHWMQWMKLIEQNIVNAMQ